MPRATLLWWGGIVDFVPIKPLTIYTKTKQVFYNT